METVRFWANSNEEAKQIAINDFVYKASKVLECYKNILETWIDHTPHTLFYSCYDSMFSNNDKLDLDPSYVDLITSADYLDKIKLDSYSKKDIRAMMGGGEIPFIYLEKIDDNKYQYCITR